MDQHVRIVAADGRSMEWTPSTGVDATNMPVDILLNQEFKQAGGWQMYLKHADDPNSMLPEEKESVLNYLKKYTELMKVLYDFEVDLEQVDMCNDIAKCMELLIQVGIDPFP